MKKALLRLLIIAAAFGIIIVVVVSVLNKKDVEKKVYNVILAKQQEVETTQLLNDAKTVKLYYEGENSAYSIAVAEMIEENNRANEYYLDFVPLLTNITTEVKDNLIATNDAYINALKTAKTKYTSYIVAYGSTNANITEKNNAIKATAVDFISSLNLAYQKGSLFFNLLKTTVNKYAYNDSVNDSWVVISYQSVIYLGDYLSTYVTQQMANQLDPEGVVAVLADQKCYKNFTAARTYFNSNGIRLNELRNESISAFVKNYAKVPSAKNFWLNVNTYIASLTEGSTEKTAANALKSFVVNNITGFII